MTKRIAIAGLFLGAIGAGTLGAQPAPQLSMTLRGRSQEIYSYGAASGKGAPKVLFLPGDGGWRGFAVDMAKAIAREGYDVYGWDIKKYLTDFTNKTTLSEAEMIADIHEVARWITRDTGERPLLAGWSQGAAMAVLAAAAPQSEKAYRGVVAIGLPNAAFLGWRTVDELTYITRKKPNEPVFSVAPRLPEVTPLPLALIYSTSDEYITATDAKRLYDTAREPKRYFEVGARNHRYDGARSEFFHALSESLRWVSLQ